ncbi:MAG TPA: SH3 domain-containing protein [Blastocatellia bacterium]|nr:SH3 domain-containing protein [Blastocatellia bacterium]
MRSPALFDRVVLTILLYLLAAVAAGAQTNPSGRAARAFVVDDRLSALRSGPDVTGEVLQRLRLGRAVYIIGARRAGAGQPGFYRVAVTRRTRGWIHEAALAVPGRAGDDRRVANLVMSLEGLDRLSLCRLFRERFARSPLMPGVLLALAEEAERSANALGVRARRRLAALDVEGAPVSLRDYYLSDPGLDRYSKLGVRFKFNEQMRGYIYDGQAYREIVARFPESPEAKRARKLMATAGEGLADRR